MADPIIPAHENCVVYSSSLQDTAVRLEIPEVVSGGEVLYCLGVTGNSGEIVRVNHLLFVVKEPEP